MTDEAATPAAAVIFDFGGVFIDSPFTAAVQAAEELGMEPATMLEAVFGSYDDDTDHPWHRLERGECTLEVARDEIVAASEATGGPRIDPLDVLIRLSGGAVRDEMVACCRELRANGIPTGLLTNNAKEFAEFWRPMVPLDELFDDVVDSCEVGMRKPDLRIYRLAVERLGVEVAATAFIDDAPGNVAAAEAVGLRAVQIGPERSDVPAAIHTLRQLAGLEPAG